MMTQQLFSERPPSPGGKHPVDGRPGDNWTPPTPTTTSGVPIYWLSGSKVADDYEDFWDGDWDD